MSATDRATLELRLATRFEALRWPCTMCEGSAIMYDSIDEPCYACDVRGWVPAAYYNTMIPLIVGMGGLVELYPDHARVLLPRHGMNERPSEGSYADNDLLVALTRAFDKASNGRNGDG